MFAIFSKLLPLFSKFRLSYITSAIPYVGLFIAGCIITGMFYSSKIDDIKEEHNAAIMALNKAAMVELEDREELLTKVIDERNELQKKFNSMSNELSDLNGRVQFLANSGQSNASGQLRPTTENPTDAQGIALQRCRSSLQRGKELIGRYSSLVEQLTEFGLKESTDKDSLVKIITKE